MLTNVCSGAILFVRTHVLEQKFVHLCKDVSWKNCLDCSGIEVCICRDSQNQSRLACSVFHEDRTVFALYKGDEL